MNIGWALILLGIDGVVLWLIHERVRAYEQRVGVLLVLMDLPGQQRLPNGVYWVGPRQPGAFSADARLAVRFSDADYALRRAADLLPDWLTEHLMAVPVDLADATSKRAAA